MGSAWYRVWAEGGEDKRWGTLGLCLQDVFCLTEAMGGGGGSSAEGCQAGLAEHCACTQPQGNWMSLD